MLCRRLIGQRVPRFLPISTHSPLIGPRRKAPGTTSSWRRVIGPHAPGGEPLSADEKVHLEPSSGFGFYLSNYKSEFIM